MLNHSLKISFLAMICIALSGCLSFGPLKYKQVRMLKKEGFVLTDEGWTLGLPERLLFDFDKTDIRPAHEQEISRLSRQLQKYDLQKVKIVGHTDNIGAPQYNLKLSQERAQSVANIFIAHGFKAQNIQIVGRGAEQPLVPNTTEENRAANRRVAVIIIP
ncbi:OmpA family protein [Acinetobacter ursingii]|uniref:OmpA family protein n=1 Tax=Acinetobacter ursingii TaxID=108980 RepID=A0AA46NB64_9GAMM|nr:OmpA family protein [Acinetobacter ursingii]MCU4357407.1 OmpA family protein [Acinetobacter ursingii]NOZ97866.1 OmpA family protein [Gammaproteobacteria bacterium]UYF71303.1 OmpA family protein [Acinetobacter ursingii]